MITTLLCNQLINQYNIHLQSVNVFGDPDSLMTANLLILAFPTYHCHPSNSILHFVRSLPVQGRPLRCYLITICSCFSSTGATPVFNPVDCEFSLGCVHQCPQNAIVFSKRQMQRPRLNRKFYTRAETEIQSQLETKKGQRPA